MITLNKEDIKSILIGATLMASGGGGPLEVALEMLNSCQNESVNLYQLEELKEDEEIAVIAAMGKPEAVKNQDFGKLLNNTYQYIKEQAKLAGRNIVGCIPVEYGGFNTFAPIYLALQYKDIKLIDADGAGRAVPGLDTTYLSLNNCPITPMVLANEKKDAIYINASGAGITTSFMEEICRTACTQDVFGSIAGLGAWIMTRKELQDYALCKDLTRAKKIGDCIKEYSLTKIKKENIFDYLQNRLGEELKTAEGASLFAAGIGDNIGRKSCTIKGVKELKSNAGFDIAEILIKNVIWVEGRIQQCIEEEWKARYINESLVLYIGNMPVMTAPDIISIYDEATGMPLSNDYIHQNKEALKDKPISFGIIRINEKWNKFEDRMDEIWKKYFQNIGYEGKCIPFSELVKSRGES